MTTVGPRGQAVIPQRVTVLEGDHAGEEGTVLAEREDRGVREVWILLDGGGIQVQRG